MHNTYIHTCTHARIHAPKIEWRKRCKHTRVSACCVDLICPPSPSPALLSLYPSAPTSPSLCAFNAFFPLIEVIVSSWYPGPFPTNEWHEHVLCLTVCLFVCLSLWMSVCMLVCLPVSLNEDRCVCLCVCLYVYVMCASVCVLVYLWFNSCDCCSCCFTPCSPFSPSTLSCSASISTYVYICMYACTYMYVCVVYVFHADVRSLCTYTS